MADRAVGAEQQLVVFNLSGGGYGVDIGTVREIIRMQEHRPGPGDPWGCPVRGPWEGSQ